MQYLPTRGRYKVYLIDEVHMLSAHSFNALLKTLEEPPPHVKFLLATTDPQKLPVTVLSRCLQFNLKRLPASLIASRLQQILAAEGVDFESPAVALLARAADGSLRDALSLLDQMLAFGAGRVTEADARSMLGTVDRQQVLRLVEGLAERDAKALFCDDCGDRRVRAGLRAAARRDRRRAAAGRLAPGSARPRRRRVLAGRDPGGAGCAPARGGRAACLPVRDPRPAATSSWRLTRAPASK